MTSTGLDLRIQWLLAMHLQPSYTWLLAMHLQPSYTAVHTEGLQTLMFLLSLRTTVGN